MQLHVHSIFLMKKEHCSEDIIPSNIKFYLKACFLEKQINEKIPKEKPHQTFRRNGWKASILPGIQGSKSLETGIVQQELGREREGTLQARYIVCEKNSFQYKEK